MIIDPNASRRIVATADWLALACLAAMLSFPFLQSRHYNPIPSFWSEWWAFAFGLTAAALLLIRPGAWRPMQLPGVVALPGALLAVALVQYFAGRWYFIESWLLYAAYLLWAVLLVLAARSFVARRGLAPLADVLAAALLFGALANTIAAALQYHDIGFRSGWVFVKIGGVPYSNLGQPNHFNHQLWLAIASLLYLHLRDRCRLSIVLPALLLLLLAATLSGSKSILLYAVALTVIAWLMRWRFHHDTDDAAQTGKLLRLSLLLLPLVLLLQWAVGMIGIAGDAALPTATQRLVNQVAGYQIRWRLAQVAWESFLQAPLLGKGIGTLPWEFFAANTRFAPEQGAFVAEHAHNLPLQWLAEFGIVPLLVLLVIAWRWVRNIAQQSWQAERCWAISLLAIAAIHSLVEYPLWYAFFLGPVALLLGATDAPAFTLNNGKRGALLCALVIAAGIVPLTTLRLDYDRLESRFNNLRKPVTAKQGEDELRTLQRDSLLAPYVMLSVSGAMKIDTTDLVAKVEVCQQVIRFAPSRRIVFKCAMLIALKGDAATANLLMQQSLRAYPGEIGKVVTELERAAALHPSLQPLLALARHHQKLMTQQGKGF